MTDANNPPSEEADEPERRRPEEDPQGANPDTGEAPGTENGDSEPSEPEEPSGPPPESQPDTGPAGVPSPKQ